MMKLPRLENELDTEVRFHLESYAEDLVRSGLPKQEATAFPECDASAR
jgi:hypothetical protein